jgi:hypothetical protein
MAFIYERERRGEREREKRREKEISAAGHCGKT